MISFLSELVAIEPRLGPVLDESHTYFEELLPHLVMGDFVRWMVEHIGTDRTACAQLIEWWESQVVDGPDDVSELIVVSGVENFPDPGVPGSELRELLGPELRKFDPWK